MRKKHGKKSIGSSEEDFPAICNIKSIFLFNNPIRLIVIAFYGDTKSVIYDKKIIQNIQISK